MSHSTFMQMAHWLSKTMLDQAKRIHSASRTKASETARFQRNGQTCGNARSVASAQTRITHQGCGETKETRAFEVGCVNSSRAECSINRGVRVAISLGA